MLTAHHLSKSYQNNLILSDISFSLNPGERVGLIGPNGCGKTTLLRILTGQDPPDEGHVARTPAELRLGYLAQALETRPEETLGKLLAESLGDAQLLQAELARLATALSRAPHKPEIQQAYDRALHRLEAYSPQERARAEAILERLGLSGLADDLPLEALSGGQKTRLALAQVLMADPQLLLLDEPTNHLDIEMLEWLEDWLVDFTANGDKAALIVSHDRAFLNQTVQRVIDLDPETHRVREYSGNYDDYLEQFLAQREKQAEAYRDQVDEIRRLKQDIRRTKEQALHVERTTTSRQPGVRRIAKKVAKKAASREKKLQRYLDSEQQVEKPRESWQMKLEFSPESHLGRDVVRMDGLSVGYAGNPPLLEAIHINLVSGKRIALTGPNGCGKTTLLRTLAGQIELLGGGFRLGASVSLGYMSQEQDMLDPALSPVEIIQQTAPFTETETRSFLHYFLFSGDDPLRPTASLSYGERARLALAALVARGCNFLLLDEPINHLDIPSRVRFERAISQFKGTVLAVVHDRYFIQRFASELWTVKGKSIQRRILALE